MKIFLLLLFIGYSIGVPAQVFETATINNDYQYLKDLLVINDGSYISVAGTAAGYQLTRVDSSGNIKWTKKYGNGLWRAAMLGERQFVVYDVRDSFGWHSAQYGELCVFDTAGHLQSATTLAESLLVEIIHPTPDHGTIALAYNQGLIYGQRIIKTDSSGSIEFIKCFDSLGLSNRIRLNDIIQLKNGDYIAAASYQYPDTNFAPGYTLLIRYNPVFDTIWTKTYAMFFGYTLSQLPDNGFISYSQNGFIKLDSLGNIQWSKMLPDTFPFIDVYDFAPGLDSSFVFAGHIVLGKRSPFLIKLDTTGNVLWMRIYSTIDGNQVSNPLVVKAENEGYVLGFSSGTNYLFHTLVKTDLTGVSLCDSFFTSPPIQDVIVEEASMFKYFNLIDLQLSIYNSTQYPVLFDSSFSEINYCLLTQANSSFVEEHAFDIWPNPTSSKFQIRSNEFETDATLEIFNLLGEKIYSAVYSGPLTVDCELFPRGIYFVRLSNSKNQLTQKLIIE